MESRKYSPTAIMNNPRRMAEAPTTICQNTEFTENMEKMLNNQQFGDTVFLVNNMKFFASSHLVSVSSAELESILKIHYENCGDREIKIGEIKFEDSFLVILRFMYGLEIDLFQMDKAVLCEVLRLAERFNLIKFFTQLKSYVSSIDCFEVDFVVVLLNTSRKFKIEELYEKLTVWAFENADELVKHRSFVDLQYDVLLDLVKADFFYTQEIDILRGVLDWHGNNISNNPDNENGNPSMIDNMGEDNDESIKVADNELVVPKESSSDESVKNKTDKLLKKFSMNVLKSLLSNIRLSCISAEDLLHTLFEMKTYTNYKEFLSDRKNFLPMAKPRTKYVAVPSVRFREWHVVDVSQKFTFDGLLDDYEIESNENINIGGMDWKLCIQEGLVTDVTVIVYLKCISSELNDWECSAECQVKMLPVRHGIIPQYIPGGSSYSNITLSSNVPQVKLGIFTYKYPYATSYSFEVLFKGVHGKVKKSGSRFIRR